MSTPRKKARRGGAVGVRGVCGERAVPIKTIGIVEMKRSGSSEIVASRDCGRAGLVDGIGGNFWGMAGAWGGIIIRICIRGR
jgi:hypothetical protein